MLKPFLKWCLLSFAAVLFVIAAASTPTPTLAAGRMPQAAPADAAKPAQPSTEKAKKLYAIDCAVCHGATGDGKTDLAKDMNLTMPDWTDPKSLAGKSDQQLFDIIRKGKDKMPAEGCRPRQGCRRLGSGRLHPRTLQSAAGRTRTRTRRQLSLGQRAASPLSGSAPDRPRLHCVAI